MGRLDPVVPRGRLHRQGGVNGRWLRRRVVPPEIGELLTAVKAVDWKWRYLEFEFMKVLKVTSTYSFMLNITLSKLYRSASTRLQSVNWRICWWA